MINFTITATRRPEILARTLESFDRNMGHLWPHEAIINIDPIGPGTVRECIDIVEHYFGDTMHCEPETPGLGKAFKTVWQAAADNKSKYIFHLEDDWELLRPVALAAMIEFMEINRDFAALRLPISNGEPGHIKTWNRYMPWNDVLGIYEVPEDQRLSVGFCGHPSLIRGDFVREVVDYLDPEKNPEKQFHRGGHPRILSAVQRYRWGIWSRPGDPPAIRDIGRQWMVENGYRKEGNKSYFVKWTGI